MRFVRMSLDGDVSEVELMLTNEELGDPRELNDARVFDLVQAGLASVKFTPPTVVHHWRLRYECASHEPSEAKLWATYSC